MGFRVSVPGGGFPDSRFNLEVSTTSVAHFSISHSEVIWNQTQDHMVHLHRENRLRCHREPYECIYANMCTSQNVTIIMLVYHRIPFSHEDDTNHRCTTP